MANGYSSDNTSDEHCAGGSSGGLIRLQGDQVIHPTSGFPLLRPVALASSADNILLDVHNYLSILLDLHNYLSNSSDHTQPGAQEPMTTYSLATRGGTALVNISLDACGNKMRKRPSLS